MKYSKYFKGVLHNDGLPNLNPIGWSRLMNIGALEYGISKLQKVRKMTENTTEPYKYDLMIIKEQELLSGLTQDLPPKDLMREMIMDSYD
jgi:hypothetical protein